MSDTKIDENEYAVLEEQLAGIKVFYANDVNVDAVIRSTFMQNYAGYSPFAGDTIEITVTLNYRDKDLDDAYAETRQFPICIIAGDGQEYIIDACISSIQEVIYQNNHIVCQYVLVGIGLFHNA